MSGDVGPEGSPPPRHLDLRAPPLKGGHPYRRGYGEPDEKAQSNFTDPESRIMKTSSEGFQQCYNAQTAVEGENQLVVGAEVTDNASDQGQLVPMVDGAAAVCGETPGQVLADASYGNEQDLRELEKRGIDGYMALAPRGQDRRGRGSRQASREGAHGRQAGDGNGLRRHEEAIIHPRTRAPELCDTQG